MRYLFALIGALVLIAAITPAVQAYNVSAEPWYGGQNVTAPNTVTAVCAQTGRAPFSPPQISIKTYYIGSAGGPGACTGEQCTIQIPTKAQYYPAVEYRGIWQYLCAGGSYYQDQTDGQLDTWHNIYANASILNVTADFKATPTNAPSPSYIYLEDNSTGYATSWNWSLSPASGWWASPSELLEQNVTIYFTVNGNYTVSHGVANAYSTDIETKTDYIWIYGNNASSSTGFQTIDGLSGNPIRNSSIQMYDIENSSWKNETAPYGDASITTLNGHTINAYAQAFGFGDADLLGQPARHNQVYPIMMWPTGMGGNVSVGNVTLYVTVQDKDTRAPISGASVTASTTAESTGTTTNAAGIATFVIKNNTLVYVTAQATGQGYKTAVQSINTGTASGGSASAVLTILLAKNTVTPTPAITTLPGGGTPTPTTTVDPYPCDADHPENCQRKQTELGNMLVGYGPMMVSFFIMLTIVGGVKMMGKR